MAESEQLGRRDIFLSYRHKDGKAFATCLHNLLVQRGFRVWFDDVTIATGYELDIRIKRAIEDVGLYIPIITPGFADPASFAFKEFCVALDVQANRSRDINISNSDYRAEFIFPILHEMVGHHQVIDNEKLLNYLANHIYQFSSERLSDLVEKAVRAFGVVEDIAVPDGDCGLRIGRFPVTNLEYRRFIMDGGYSNGGLRRWWSETGIEFWLHYAARVPHPFFGRREDATTIRTEDAAILSNLTASNLLFNRYGQPVTGVSYFEAEAYCKWLSHSLECGYRVRLPTEREWLAAALRNGEYFPWGNEPSPSANIINIVDKREFRATGLTLDVVDLDQVGRVNTPTTFGTFPVGASHSGCHDMFGNIWEWMGDWLDPEVALKHSGDDHNIAIIAGHCCFDSPFTIEARGTPIAYRRPGYRHHVIGFRIAIEGKKTDIASVENYRG